MIYIEKESKSEFYLVSNCIDFVILQDIYTSNQIKVSQKELDLNFTKK